MTVAGFPFCVVTQVEYCEDGQELACSLAFELRTMRAVRPVKLLCAASGAPSG